LTKRQKEILELLSEGYTNLEICGILKLSENTVKTHISHIYEKMDVTNRTEAALQYKMENTVSSADVKLNADVKPTLIVEFKSRQKVDAEMDCFTFQLSSFVVALLSKKNLLVVIQNTPELKLSNDKLPEYHLCGNVQKLADKIHIQIILKNYESGKHLWSTLFEFDYNQSISNYVQCANKITASTLYNLISKEAGEFMMIPLENCTIFQKNILGLHYLYLSTVDSYEKARSLFDSIKENDLRHGLYGKAISIYCCSINYPSKNPLKDYEDIKSCFTQMAMISKEFPETWFIRAIHGILNRDMEGAIISLQNVLRLDSSFQEAYFLLAQLYAITGDTVKGEEYFQTALFSTI
jgi:Response regulator containing a CheY-like receiver domain and an HTH DNA-binding domain